MHGIKKLILYILYKSMLMVVYCSYCNKSFPNEQALGRHINYMFNHPEIPHTANMNDLNFDNWNNWE